MANLGKTNGWHWDRSNGRLDIYQGGTKVATVDAVSGLELLTGGMDIAGGVSIAGGMNVSGASTFAGAMTLSEPVTFADTFWHANASTETLTGDATLTITQAGKILQVSGAGLSDYVIALPAPMDVGSVWTFVNVQPDACSGGVKLDVSGEKWFGCGLSGVSAVDLINTAATHIRGDYVKLMAGATGVYIIEMGGTWGTT